MNNLAQIKFYANAFGAIITAIVAVFSIVTFIFLMTLTDYALIVTFIAAIIYSAAFYHFNQKVCKIIDNTPTDEIQ